MALPLADNEAIGQAKCSPLKRAQFSKKAFYR
jgi:hypothetical protein